MGRGCRWSQSAPRLPGTRTSPAPCWTRSSLTHAKGLMPPIVWIDGTYHDRSDAKVSVFDHGLLYGDGVFEGIRVYNRRVFRDRKSTRLNSSHQIISYAVFCLKKKKEKTRKCCR